MGDIIDAEWIGEGLCRSIGMHMRFTGVYERDCTSQEWHVKTHMNLKDFLGVFASMKEVPWKSGMACGEQHMG